VVISVDEVMKFSTAKKKWKFVFCQSADSKMQILSNSTILFGLFEVIPQINGEMNQMVNVGFGGGLLSP